MSQITITERTTELHGIKMESDGTIVDFEGAIEGRAYRDIMRATRAARRKYNDPTIDVCEINVTATKMRIDSEDVKKYATITE